MPGCTNQPDKKSNITLVTRVTLLWLFATYSQPWHIWYPSHIQNPFKYLRWWVMLKTPSGSEKSFAFSGIFSCIQKHSAMFRHFEGHQTILRSFRHYWGILCHFQKYSGLCVTLAYATMAYLESEASSKACSTCKMIRHIWSPGIVRTIYSNIFKDIYGYLETLMHIQPHSGSIPFA